MHETVGENIVEQLTAENDAAAIAQVDRTADRDDTHNEVCPDPTQPIARLACKSVGVDKESVAALACEPTEYDILYALFKEKVNSRKERAAIRLGKRLAEDLPRGPILASNLMLRTFPDSRRAKKLVDQFVAASNDPEQKLYLAELRESYS